jgi:hypothetical protein
MTLRQRLLFLTLGAALLTGCSSVPREATPSPIEVKPLSESKPARPNPIQLYNEPYKVCGPMVCLKPSEAQRSLENKVEIGRWMGQANSLIKFYENRSSSGAVY